MASHQPYGDSYYGSQAYYNDPAPSYHSTPSQQHLTAATGDSHSGTTATAAPTPNGSSSHVSPFETVFDDHVYPSPSQTPATAAGVTAAAAVPASSRQQLHQQQTGYYGYGGYGGRSPSSEDDLPGADGIPLRDRAGAKRAESPDGMAGLVYDAPQHGLHGGGYGGYGGAGAGPGVGLDGQPGQRVRFGELGMIGPNKRRIPYVVYLFTLVQVAVFIAEIVKNGVLTKSPIEIHPSFNPMIGPSPYVLINMGSRYVPCMHNVAAVQGSTQPVRWPCPNTTTNDASAASNHCTLSELCGFGGVAEPKYDGNASQTPEPNQWFRFIVPIFLHAGLIHIGFNMMLQLTVGRDMERSIGSLRFFVVYVSSGIFGFVMGGNYAATGISSTGASGSLFGIIALTLLDLLYSWRDRRNPAKDLLFIMLDVVISFVLGLLPGLDNFSHIGGFLMGLALGISVLHSPNALRRRIGEDPSYATVDDVALAAGRRRSTPVAATSFLRSPLAFFQGRKPLWWAWWLLRFGTIVVVIVVFILLLKNFYVYHHTCGWCKYLSCLPVNNWCELGNLQLTDYNTTKRDLLAISSSAPSFVPLL